MGTACLLACRTLPDLKRFQLPVFFLTPSLEGYQGAGSLCPHHLLRSSHRSIQLALSSQTTLRPRPCSNQLRNPTETVHGFRRKSSTDSDGNRPRIPSEIVQ